MLKLKKWKIVITAVVMMVLMIVPSTTAHAVEISTDILEVPQDEKRHTVIAFGESIAIVYSDGKMEIIANNPSGRMDVMLDGKVNKKIDIVLIPPQNGINMILEEGSFILSDITENQANALKEIVSTSLSGDIPITNLSVIENEDKMQGISAFIVGQQGELLTSNGDKAVAGISSEIAIKTPETVYESFAREMQENIRQEQEAAQKEQEQRDANAVTIVDRDELISEEVREEKETNQKASSSEIISECNHEWQIDDSTSILMMPNYVGCATSPIYICPKCNILRWELENYHEHGDDYCEYCRRNKNGEIGCVDGNEHDYHKVESPYIWYDNQRCWTGVIRECNNCRRLDFSNAEMHEHGDSYCEYCGFNKNGDSKPEEELE